MSADRDYFGWRTPEHAKGCRRTGWEVRHREDEHISGRREVVLQAICPQPGGCGVAHKWSADIAADTELVRGEEMRRSDLTYRVGSVVGLGYGTAPIRVGGAWLHSGPPLLAGYDGDAPDYYVVTAAHAPPTEWSDVLGVIGQARTRGRLVKRRWWARSGYHERRGSERRGSWSFAHATDDCSSRGAAVAWVGANHDVAAVEQPVGGEA